MAGPKELTHPVQLLAEGKDDYHFLIQMVGAIGREDVQVQDYEGVGNLAVFLKVLVNSPEFSSLVKTVGVTRDANGDAAAAFASVQARLASAGLVSPPAVSTLHDGDPATSVFVLPGDGQPGTLETLCLAAVAGHTSVPCVTEFLTCVSNEVVPAERFQNEEKARLRSYLSCREPPGMPIGLAVASGLIPADDAAFDGIKAFLAAL